MGEQLEGGFMEIGEGGGHAVRNKGHAVVSGGSGYDGSAHADVGRDARGHEVGDALAAQGKVQWRAVELVVGVALYDQFTLQGGQLLDGLGGFHSFTRIRADEAVRGGMLEARRLAFLCGQVFHAEWIASQAGYVVGVDELGEDDGSSRGPEGVDETAEGRDDCPSGGHFKRGALVEEAVLHVDDEQGGLAGNEPVLLLDEPIYFRIVYVHSSDWVQLALASRSSRRNTGASTAESSVEYR